MSFTEFVAIEGKNIDHRIISHIASSLRLTEVLQRDLHYICTQESYCGVLVHLNIFTALTMQLIVFFVKILIFAVVSADDTRISRLKGNIFQNLTGNQEFDNHIVTSSLDNSPLIRMVYRGIREVYSRLVSGTGERHDSERFQQRVSASAKFPCRVDGFKSPRVPKSVHQLRPGGEIN